MRISPAGSPVKVTKVTNLLTLQAGTTLQAGSYSVFDENDPDVIITKIIVIIKNCETKLSDMCDKKISYQQILASKNKDAGHAALAEQAKENLQVLGM